MTSKPDWINTCVQHSSWDLSCDDCYPSHMAWHCVNEDLRSDFCFTCTKAAKQRKAEEALKRKKAGIEKRRKTMAAKRAARLEAQISNA